jgi:hypothetical protein
MILAPESAVGKASATIRRQQSWSSLSAWGVIVSIGIFALAIGAPAVQAQPPLVTRVHGIATGLAACWRPPHADDQVTVRMSFTRDGAVIGEPRIVYAYSSAGAADDSELAQSMLTAVRDCTPLHFSSRLGSAIAGQVLDIRFIGRNRATIVAPP